MNKTYEKLKEKHRSEPKYFLKRCWRGIRTRCTTDGQLTSKYYLGKDFCSMDEFIDTFINDEKFLSLYKQWQLSKFNYEIIPSIDRIDKFKDYTLDNLQFLTMQQNSGKEKEKLPVLMFDLNGNFIREFESKWQAHKELGIPNGNICKVVYGKRNSAGGYIFKFKDT